MVTAQPLVSVVTPVYNGERYLAECIESVLAQTYERWEYTIVDNCSTDRTREIAERYAEKDSRIRVHANATFVDVLRNHNIAFRQVSPVAAYCKVVQADDWLFPECIERMVAVGEAHPTVGIVGAYRLDGAKVDCDGLPYPSPIVPGRELCRATLLGGPGVFGSPTSILIRADQVRSREAFFDESDIHADTASCFEVLRSTDFGFVHQVLTFTRRREESQTTVAEERNSYLPSALRHLAKHGPVFLSEAERAAVAATLLRFYYRFLARSVLEGRGREFWAYHRQQMESLGYGFSRMRVLRMALGYAPKALWHPRDVARRVARLGRHARRRVSGRRGAA
jgi:glycosyltransferase involved in cell wall biosynthesis